MTSLPSIDACTIQVNNGRKLTVVGGKYVNVQNKSYCTTFRVI